MGQSTSYARHPIIPSLPEACSRFGPADAEALRQAFSRSTGNKDILRYRQFSELVLSNVPEMPHQVAKQLFNAFDVGDHGDVDWDNFVRTFAVLCHGTPKEQIRLLFYICNKNRTGYCDRPEFVEFAKLFNHKHAQERGWLRRNQLLTLFPRGNGSSSSRGSSSPTSTSGTDPIAEEEFVTWALQSEQRQSNMIQWISGLGAVLLRAPKNETMYTASDPATQRQQLASSTHFSLLEVKFLQNRFTSLEGTSSSTAGVIGRAAFHQLFADALPETTRDIMFLALLRNGNTLGGDGTRTKATATATATATRAKKLDVVNTHCVIRALSCCSRGAFEERIDFCFSLFDTNGDGTLSKEELETMVGALAEFR